MTLKSKKLEEQVAKRSKYSDGVGYKGAKLSSVKKVFMIGLVPKVQENYENVKKILTTINLSGLPISFSCDIKLDLYLVGKQNASCAHHVSTVVVPPHGQTRTEDNCLQLET